MNTLIYLLPGLIGLGGTLLVLFSQDECMILRSSPNFFLQSLFLSIFQWWFNTFYVKNDDTWWGPLQRFSHLQTLTLRKAGFFSWKKISHFVVAIMLVLSSSGEWIWNIEVSEVVKKPHYFKYSPIWWWQWLRCSPLRIAVI